MWTYLIMPSVPSPTPHPLRHIGLAKCPGLSLRGSGVACPLRTRVASSLLHHPRRRHSASQAKSIFHQKSAFLIVALPLLSATPHPSSSLSAGGQLKTSSFDPHFSLWSTLSFFTCFEAHRGVGSRMCWRMPLFRGDRDKVK